MVTRRARSLFAVLLTLALLPIVSMAEAGTPDARAHATMAWMQWTAKSQSAVQGSRTGLGEIAAHHLAATPCAAAEPFRFSHYAAVEATVRPTPRVTATRAPATLHPARAPPALL
jgi:hypothetical protein